MFEKIFPIIYGSVVSKVKGFNLWNYFKRRKILIVTYYNFCIESALILTWNDHLRADLQLLTGWEIPNPIQLLKVSKEWEVCTTGPHPWVLPLLPSPPDFKCWDVGYIQLQNLSNSRFISPLLSLSTLVNGCYSWGDEAPSDLKEIFVFQEITVLTPDYVKTKFNINKRMTSIHEYTCYISLLMLSWIHSFQITRTNGMRWFNPKRLHTCCTI